MTKDNNRELSDVQNKEIRIFQYLKDFTNLRETITRDIIKNEDFQVIWFGNLPQGAYTPFDELQTGLMPTWIQINKPIKPLHPELPKLPPDIAPWIESSSLFKENSLPMIYNEIESESGPVLLSEEPAMKMKIEEYLQTEWVDIACKYAQDMVAFEIQNKKFHELQTPYQELFGMYNKLKQSPEEYEVVLGLGFCQFFWKGLLIQRHLLIGKADIQFDPEEAVITVSANIDGLSLSIETEMISDLDELQVLESEKILAEKVANLEDSENPFSEEVKVSLRVFTNRLQEQAEFLDELLPSKEVKSTPQILYAPAIVFRKRKTKSYQHLFETIIKDIETNQDQDKTSLMSEILDLGTNEKNSIQSEKRNETFSDVLYFPKIYNKEQVRIIEKLEYNNKVLVLGPPGTGKSHTIANLICHLLATGNKILVTAQTKRALEVLHGLLPNDIGLLTINLLGSDKNSLSGLEMSINTITERLNSVELYELQEKIDQHLQKIHEEKSSKAELENAWIESKKIDFQPFEISSSYKGLLSDITALLFEQSSLYGWFRDVIEDLPLPKKLPPILKAFKLHTEWKNKDTSQFTKPIPDPETLISSDELLRYKELSTEFQGKPRLQTFSMTDDTDFESLQIAAQSYANNLNKIMSLADPMAKEILEAEIIENSSHWKRIYEETRQHVNTEILTQIYYSDYTFHFVFPTNKSLKQLASDIQIVYEYAQTGKSLNNKIQSLLFPKKVKERKYVMTEILVNGRPCDTMEDLVLVKNHLTHQMNLHRLNAIWKEEIWHPSETLYLGYQKYNQLLDSLNLVYHYILEMKQSLNSLESLLPIEKENRKSYEYFVHFAKKIEDSKKQYQWLALKAKIKQSLEDLTKNTFHPIAITLKDALLEDTVDIYKESLAKIPLLKTDVTSYNSYITLMKTCKKRFPCLMEDIENEKITEEQIDRIKEAIEWKMAKQSIEAILVRIKETNYDQTIKDQEKLVEKELESLVHLKAWYFILKHLKEDNSLRQHLTSWMQFVKKIGKSDRSKRTIKFRKLAQEEMTNCRNAIPCWIMPLYKVVDTIKPMKGFFDYIIIDEASQLGPESFFLFYLAKNIIIVGDDKQTSPEYIGVLANQMKPYIEKYLYDIPFSQYFGTDFSLFDFGRILCDDTIVLREHFRCMPEIIEFCSQMWYQPNGYSLYPLRQYNENRLVPLVTEYIENGFTEGTKSSILNRNEADRIVQTLIKCLGDDRYQDKTFGIITLQGSYQSKYIEKEILENIDPREIEKRKIISGIPSDFQGDERDVIFLSLVTARDHNRAPFTKPEDDRRFNVAVSRAKDQLWLFHSVQPDDLTNTDDLRYKLLLYMLKNKNKELIDNQELSEPFESKFEQEIYKSIRAKGFWVIPQYKVAQYRIDLVVVLRNGIKIAVECDGDTFHGNEQYKADMFRQRELERFGWQFFRIRASLFYTNPVSSLEPLWDILEKNETVLVEKSR